MLRTAADNVTRLAFAAERRVLLDARRPPLSIDIACAPGPQQQTRRTQCSGRRKGPTDGQTDGRRTVVTCRIQEVLITITVTQNSNPITLKP